MIAYTHIIQQPSTAAVSRNITNRQFGPIGGLMNPRMTDVPHLNNLQQSL